MKKLLAALFLVSGCSATLHPDTGTVSAPDANYATAELWSGDRIFHGLGEVLLHKGDSLNAAALKVQGYYAGAMRIDSEKCNFHEAYHYEKSELKLINIPGTASETCLFDVVVAPLYPNNQADGGTRVYEFKGQLMVKVLEQGQDWAGLHSKIKVGTNLKAQMSFPTGVARVVFRGCGSEFDQAVTSVNGILNLDADMIIHTNEVRRCELEGFASHPPSLSRISWRIWTYNDRFSPLPLPSITVSGRKLSVKADPAVSIIALDSKYYVTTSANFTFDAKKRHILRLLTTNARSVLCDWQPSVGSWQCLN